MYTKLEIPGHVGPLVTHVVQRTIDPRFADVHALLRLPMPGVEGPEAGGNFAIADALFGVIEGISAVLFPRYGGAQQAFLECVKKHYGSEVEPGGGRAGRGDCGRAVVSLSKLDAAQPRIAITRPDNQGIRWRQLHADGLLVFGDRAPLSSDELTMLETHDWPACLHRPTLQRDKALWILAVEAFYVGTRRLVSSVLISPKWTGTTTRSTIRYRSP